MSVNGHRAPGRSKRPEAHNASRREVREGSTLHLREHRLRLERLSRKFLREAVSSLDDAYSARMFLYARAARLIVAGLRLLEKADKK